MILMAYVSSPAAQTLEMQLALLLITVMTAGMRQSCLHKSTFSLSPVQSPALSLLCPMLGMAHVLRY